MTDLHDLLFDSSKHNTLTATQQALLAAFARGDSDAQIAAATAVTPSTVRHQRYTFRQKAAQAELYLAQYHAAFGEGAQRLALPLAAQSLGITNADYEKELKRDVDYTAAPTLAHWPRQEKRRVCLIARMVQGFEPDVHYSRLAVQAKLRRWSPDDATLTRYLIDYGFLARTPDGRDYWRIF
ncbi:MAG: DUF2087 domain-containing protein [Lactobacillus sp.]|jgi:hypothetical protein|uniref:DUF2087 domain-containing protein n=1 Tax=Lacticaseibacillus suilingensis TaxID=2799577 RepID=UPI0022E0CA51|nr:DUF2087 domain-containing protein [Lacticaseibacillus suilingensis]MCI1894034.1 DUF2087 domain-containing protein [Lactobacillus sp.]MCI1917177.1 DUF2087 domain-containing protein [Lactobacillus sp.]MCI1942033.1 DUF2087 domain-containing protein [Lactobacillus sp.]MCI1972360.1 DUF2087 domain-containing protein [Lactobacillus sp.]MCI2016718.1 DUF2087 domain-containing protein [Lactobacillus sp.]